ncbi:MAG: TonB-dependent receptor [Moraxellaceae bacterium]|nr:MAG: TonB-dependent receptor [Moraxellaceae bacterium]
MKLKPHPLVQAMALAILLPASGHALADSHVLLTTPSVTSPTSTLPTIVISAHPLDRSAADIATPVSVAEHDQLASGAATLGQALAGQPGIHADSFGGGSSRPVIRGQTAPRVKVLSDGSEVMDASAISPDHAVTVEPLLAEKIEVLRGPSTLLYGSGAIGGAVNVLDNKIPTRMPENGLEGEINLRGNTVADEKAAAAALTLGLGEQFALHVEGIKRDANDYKVRGYSNDGQNEKRVDGSYATGENASIGLSWIGERGFAGLAFTQRNDEYGLPGHSHEYESCELHDNQPHGTHLHCDNHDDDGDHDGEEAQDHDDGHEHEHKHEHDHEAAPWIELDSKRVDFRAEYAQPFSGFDKIRVRAGYTDYQHDEIEAGKTATTFTNKGYDGRIELTHVPVAGFKGVVGLQYARSDFEALGEEAFLPKTLTENISAFLLENYQWKDVHVELGARQEWQTINPKQGLAKFSTQDYDDTATSASLAASWQFVPDYALALSLSHAERMPNAQELYANGGHFATNTYELGDAKLRNEKSNNIELSLRKTAGDFTFGLSAYHNQINDYIYARTLDQYQDFRLIQYTQADATFNGLEAESSYQFDDNYSATLLGDYVRAKLDGRDADGRRNLPRIPAARFGSRVQANWDVLGGELGGSLEYYHIFKQNNIADYESTTAGYNLINATLAYDGELNARNSYRLYLQMNNVLDEKYYSHSSFLSAIPQLGRNFTAGVQLKF